MRGGVKWPLNGVISIFFVCVCMCVRVIVTLPQMFFFLFVEPFAASFDAFGGLWHARLCTSRQHSEKEGFLAKKPLFLTSRRGGVEKKRKANTSVWLCVRARLCTCVQRGWCMFLWARHVPARSFFEGNGEVPFCSFGALSAEGGGAGDVRLRPPLFALLQSPFFRAVTTSPPSVGNRRQWGKKERSYATVWQCSFLYKKKKKKLRSLVV